MQKRYDSRTFRPYPGDENLIVKFSLDDFKNEAKTREAGRAVYEDREIISITLAGGNNPSIIAPADSYCTMPELEIGQGTQVTYKDRFPEDYDRWKAGHEASVVGTHLKHAPFLSTADVSNLLACNVFTIEQLADLGGDKIRSVGMNGRKWQQMALSYLDSANSTKDATSYAAEKAALMDEINSLREALNNRSGNVSQQSDTYNVSVENRAVLESETKTEAERKIELKKEIERITGKKPLGNPSVERLEADLSELNSQ